MGRKKLLIYANCATWSLYQFFHKGGALRCRWVRGIWIPLPHLDWSIDGINWYTLYPSSRKEEGFRFPKDIFLSLSKPDIVKVDEFYIPHYDRRTSFFPELLVAISVALFVVWFLATVIIWPMLPEKKGKKSS